MTRIEDSHTAWMQAIGINWGPNEAARLHGKQKALAQKKF
jgi:hypothetical protein